MARKMISIIDPKKFYEGTIYNMKNGSKAIVTEYNGRDNVKIKFLDDTNYETTARMFNIVNRSCKNPYLKTKYGGYFGVGPYIASNDMKIYKTWEGMLKRAHAHLDKSSYFSCTVCAEWLNLQNFANWYTSYREKLNPKYWDILEIDKDIFQFNLSNKIYSSDTCCLIPRDLNDIIGTIYYSNKQSDLPVGVRQQNKKYTVYISRNNKKQCYGTYSTKEEAFNIYHIEKKKQIEELALFYLSENAILLDVFKAIQKIEILPYNGGNL